MRLKLIFLIKRSCNFLGKEIMTILRYPWLTPHFCGRIPNISVEYRLDVCILQVPYFRTLKCFIFVLLRQGFFLCVFAKLKG